jgi:ABC-type branched-subunit amino acid transport system ATPase component
MSSAILLENVTKNFKDFTAVNDLSFEVKAGDVYGFLGPNGSGKSTTLRMIMALIKPTSGSIQLFGQSLQDKRDEIMRKIGCIIEKPDFYGYLSAKENMKLFARAHRLDYVDKQYDELFELVGLKGREKDKVKTFSHGMKQRLGLAQALIHDPELIILDEPNTGLDPQGIIDLRQLILVLNKERGKTILFSSHILSEVQEICNNMVVINKGKVVVQGGVNELLSHENLTVKLEAVNPLATAAALRQSKWANVMDKQDGNLFVFKMGKTEIPQMVDYLSQHQLGIERIDYRNQLEDYFLKITNA